jgi:hypothetical protein
LHTQFGTNFRKSVTTLLALQRRPQSPFSILPDECLFYILNMCRWDWFQDTAPQLKEEQRVRKQKLLRQRREQQRAAAVARFSRGHDQLPAVLAQVVVPPPPLPPAAPQDDDERNHLENGNQRASLAQAVEQVVNNANNQDDDDDDEAGDSDESEWERTNGYRADTTAFSYRYLSSDEDVSNAERPPFYSNLFAWRLGRGAQQPPDEPT